MLDIQAAIQSGGVNAWLMIPTAISLGALHALEPGHSKSMMTAFIVSIHGTAGQAAVLGLSATVGHTIVIWILAVLAWRLGDAGFLERAEPWLLLIGGLLIVALALRILMRLDLLQSNDSHHDDHDKHEHHHASLDDDAHAAAHEAEISSRFSGGPVTNSEVVWFGFSGGLLPCPAAFAVLLACLQQKAYGLGIAMVAAFSAGLALMLVAIGIAAAWSAAVVKRQLGGVETIARWAPSVSAVIVLSIGLAVTLQGAHQLALF